MRTSIRTRLATLTAMSLAFAASAQAETPDHAWLHGMNADHTENALMLRLRQPFGGESSKEAAPRLSLSFAQQDNTDLRAVDVVSYALTSGDIKQRIESPFIYRAADGNGHDGFFSNMNDKIFAAFAAAAVLLIVANANNDDPPHNTGCGFAPDEHLSLSTQAGSGGETAVYTCMQ